MEHAPGVLASAGVFGASQPFLRHPMDHTYHVPAMDTNDDDNPLFASNDFRMLYMKVLPCAKRYTHDWTVCPFSHTGEKARRRDPRLYNYTGIACPDMKRVRQQVPQRLLYPHHAPSQSGNCIRGDRCPYAHNVFEYWLHPTRYRTQLCNDGQKCSRRVCFFAHTLDEVRVPKQKPYVSPEALAAASLEAIAESCHAGGPAANQGPIDLLAPAAMGGLYKSASCPPGAMPLGGVGNPAASNPFAAHAPSVVPHVPQGYGGPCDLPPLDVCAPPPTHTNLAAPDLALLAGLPPQFNLLPLPHQGGSPTHTDHTTHTTHTTHTNGSARAGDHDLAASLASIRTALATGKLQQHDVLRMLGDLSLGGDAGASGAAESGSGASAVLQTGQGGEDEGLRAAGSKSTSPGLEQPKQAPMEQQLSSGSLHSATALLPVSGGMVNRLWSTASAPVVAGGIHTTLLGPPNAMPSVQLPGADWGNLPPLSESPFPPHADVLPDTSRAMLEELLQQSAATQHSAAANGQASRQAKLAKASSLTNWLHKLKQQG